MNQSGRGRLSSLLSLAGLVVLAWLIASEQTLAQNSQSSCVVTTRGSRDVLDVVFLMECSNAETVGVLHFDVRAVAGPSSSDRELEIVFTMSPSSDGRSPVVHRQSIVLKEGATSARGMMPFVLNSSTEPSQQRMHFWNVGVFEERRDVEASRMLQASQGGPFIPVRLAAGEPPPFMVHQRGSQSGAVLHILDSGAKFDAKLDSQIAARFIKDTSGLGIRPVLDVPTFDLARNFMSASNIRHIESLPEYWHYYLQFSAVTLNHQALARLQAERPLAATAIKQYVAAGGDLILACPKADGARLIDQWITNREDGHKPEYWTTDRQAVQAPPFQEDATAENATETTADPFALSTETQPIENQSWAENQRWAKRTHGRGRLICLEEQETTSLPALALARSRAVPVGIAISSVHDQTWSLRNMITSVGKPPVWTFCGIILLFGLILGPGLLILTAWIGRRSLLILLVPLVSIGATLAIVAYEVLHEGFGTHVRISSVLNIDERSGDGFVWSRQNVFSGWPPRDGLSVPNDIYCRPVGNVRLGRAGTPRNASSYQYIVEHQKDVSIWRGVLQAREQRQFLIGHPAKLSMPIEVKRIDDKRASLRNLTDETLPFVVMRDGSSGYYFAEKVAPNAQLELASVPFGDIAGVLSRMRTEMAPTLPADLRALGWGVAQEQNSSEILDQEWLGAMAEQSAVSTIPPYGFVTLIRNCSAVYVPLKATASESLHLVTGSAVW